MTLNKEQCAIHLAEGIKCKTVSYADQSLYDFNEFSKLHEVIKKCFPNVFGVANYEVINQGSLLIKIDGSNKELEPVLFMAHMDVVSATDNIEGWTHDPFSGYIDDTYIWGRGAIDTKSMVFGELEAIENLLANGFIPKRDIYFAYGHDEETAGGMGQYVISRMLKEKGLKFYYVIDEGGTYTYANLYGAPNQLICPIGVFEKGYLDVSLKTYSNGGHSSNPKGGSSLGLLCKAIGKIEENQFAPYLPKPLETTFLKLKDSITVEPLKTYVNDIKKYKKELIDYCYHNEGLNPYVHTTIATTMLSGGSNGANVLPMNCSALINLRTSEIDSNQAIMEKIKSITSDVHVSMVNGLEPSNTSLVDSPVLNKIEEIVNRYIDNCKVVPVLLCGGTDCRFYDDLSDCCYRFSPYQFDNELSKTVHSINERMPIDGYYEGIKMFIDLIKETC